MSLVFAARLSLLALMVGFLTRHYHRTILKPIFWYVRLCDRRTDWRRRQQEYWDQHTKQAPDNVWERYQAVLDDRRARLVHDLEYKEE